MPKRYPPEIRDYIAAHVDEQSNRMLAGNVNRLFGTAFTAESMKIFIGNHKLYRKSRKRLERVYTDAFPKEIADYIEANYLGVGPTEMAQRLNGLFGTGYRAKQLKSYYSNHNLDSGVSGRYEKGHEPWSKGRKMSPEQYERCKGTMFQKGLVPHNRMELGECTHTSKDGYLIRKVREHGTQRERFEYVHRAVWEEHHGPIPEGMMVIFLDGNKENCSIENLALVSKSENAVLNHCKLRFENAEATSAGLGVARLKIATRKLKKDRTKKGVMP